MTKEEFIDEMLIVGAEMGRSKKTEVHVKLYDKAYVLYEKHMGKTCMYCEKQLTETEAIIICKKCTE